jgi:FKBP-type peptidyl-prolyl cis-trans isomerase SlyD
MLTVDGNHPFAGKTVTFRVKVADVRDATAEEMQSGQPTSPGQGHLLQ